MYTFIIFGKKFNLDENSNLICKEKSNNSFANNRTLIYLLFDSNVQWQCDKDKAVLFMTL